MATSSEAAWTKYFKGNGDVKTFLTEASPKWDVGDPNRRISGAVLQKGTSITLLETKTYDPKPIIEYIDGNKTKQARVAFNHIQKPIHTTKTGGTKSIPNKALSPSGLGLNGKKIHKDKFIETVKSALSTRNDIDKTIQQFCIDLLEASGKSGMINLGAASTKGISDADIKIIGKDFGEFTGAWWFLNNFKSDEILHSIEYPVSGSAGLFDYIVKDGFEYKVSAKYGEGAVPSMSNVWEAVDNRPTQSGTKNDKIKKFISEIINNSGKEGIVASAKSINSKSYKILSDLINDKNLTDDKIEKWIAQFGDSSSLLYMPNPEDVYQYLNDNYYSKIGRSVDRKTIEKLNDTRKSKSGLVTSPMAYATVDEINDDGDYTEFLTGAVSSVQVHQIYLRIYRSGVVTYDTRKFEDSKFIFEYHSNAADPGNNKIGFKLVK